jgi:glycosyltransferase involved in cell wall biosynthesis
MQPKKSATYKTAKPLVSVIIPTYNRAWCLMESIDSVFSQTFTDYELIVVDDGSTDDTLKQLSRYDQITVITQSNQGVSAARNKGILQSRGELITFLDSDDLWLPAKLAAQVRFFNQNPEARICQTQEIWIRNDKRIYPKNRHLKTSGYFFERSLELCLVSPSAVMMKRRLFSDVGLFDEQLPACEDYDLWLRIGAHLPIFLIDDPLVVKRGGHADQLSANPGLDKYRIQSILKLLENGILSQKQQKAAADVLQKKCHIVASGCQKRGKLEEMRFYRNLVETGATHAKTNTTEITAITRDT